MRFRLITRSVANVLSHLALADRTLVCPQCEVIYAAELDIDEDESDIEYNVWRVLSNLAEACPDHPPRFAIERQRTNPTRWRCWTTGPPSAAFSPMPSPLKTFASPVRCHPARRGLECGDADHIGRPAGSRRMARPSRCRTPLDPHVHLLRSN